MPSTRSVAAAFAEGIAQDLKLAIRSLRSHRIVAVGVILLLALALAANAAVFAVFDGLLFRPPPFADAERIVYVAPPARETYTQAAGFQRIDEFESSPLFAETALVSEGTFQVADDGSVAAAAAGLRSKTISPNLFSFLGVVPVAGRLLTDEDGGVWPRPAVISYELWQSLFNGDPSVVGQVIPLPGVRESRRPLLVGVTPAGFTFPPGTNLWTVLSPQAVAAPNLVKLAPHGTLAEVRTTFPHFKLTPLREFLQPLGARASAVLLVTTAILLVVAWVQMAALLSARSASRTLEVGVRLALGATRLQLARQIGMESLVIAAVATGLAWPFVPGLTAFIVTLLPEEMTAGQRLVVDHRTFVFSGMVSGLGIVVMSLASIDVLRRSTPLNLIRGSVFGRANLTAGTTRAVLLVSQLAFTTILLYMGGLTLQSFLRATRANTGFSHQNVIAVTLPPTAAGPTFTILRARFNQALETVKDLPGVNAAAAGGRIPFRLAGGAGSTVAIFTSSANPGGEPFSARHTRATEGYVDALGLRIVQGRAPSERDSGAQALVNTTLAASLSRFGPVLGQRLTTRYGSVADIVGVFDDVVVTRLSAAPEPEVIYFEYQPFLSSEMPFLIAKLRDTSPDIIQLFRNTMSDAFADYPDKTIISLTSEFERATSEYRAHSIMVTMLVALCLPLAALGVTGALYQSTREQSREIGVRLALGASPRNVVRMILTCAARHIALGVAIGLVVALAISRWIAAYLYGVQAVDAISIAATVLVLATLGLGSALLPAARASRLNPTIVLRDA